MKWITVNTTILVCPQKNLVQVVMSQAVNN